MLTMQEARALASRSTPDGSAVTAGGLAVAMSVLFAFAACSSGSSGAGVQALPPSAGASGYAPTVGSAKVFPVAASGKVTLTTSSLALFQTGSASAKTVTVGERNYYGAFTESTTCKGIATATQTSGKGPSFKVTVTGIAAGSCAVTFSDAKKNKAALTVTDTTAAVLLSSSSISPGSTSISVTLETVNGHAPAKSVVATVISALPACSSQCTIPAPQTPVGSDVFAITIYDATGGTGNKLAAGTTAATIVTAKANSIVASLAKIPMYVSFGTIPSATAGTPLTAALPLTVSDADRNPIVGTYATPIDVADNDTSSTTQGTSLNVSGSAGSRAVKLTGSSQSINLVYGGLAIPPVTLSANIGGSTGVTAQFAPSIGGVGYQGPRDGSTPEIDLYNPNSGNSGYSGSFSLSQAGWSNAPFDKSFAYTLGGTNNNCSSFVVVPPSGSSPSAAFTVKVGASPVAGFCTLTATGALSSTTLSVVFSYTTGSIGASAKRKP
jgi:hypothetical protein